MSDLKCTYCGGTKFYEGPSGGMSTNILCANEKCRHWFNATPFGMDDLKRVEPTAEEQTAEQVRRRAGLDAARFARQSEGVKAFEEGRSAQSLRTDGAYGGYAEAAQNLDRLTGFLDRLAQEVRGHPRDETIAGTTTILRRAD